jgi:hypothetical protein
VDHLETGERVTLDELWDCTSGQGVEIAKGDVRFLRTGAMDLFYREGPRRSTTSPKLTTGEKMRSTRPEYPTARNPIVMK